MKIFASSPSPDAAIRPPTSAAGRSRYLHLFALSSLAVAQPLLDVLARDAEFFIVRRASSGEILALVAALVVVLPLPLIALVALASRAAPRLGAAVHGLSVGALATLLALLALRHLALLDGPAWLATGLALGGAYAWAYRRFAALRTLNSFLGAALVVVPAAFFFDPRIAKIFSGRQAADLHVSGARTPVVFLVFDELSLTALLDERRQIDAVSYPNLAALAGEAYWFTNAITVSDVTELAVPALLTGRMPKRDQLPILEDHPHNLFTALGGDYRVWAVEPITRLCPGAINVAAGGTRAPTADLASLLSDVWILYQHLLLPPRYAAGLPVISDRWGDFGRVTAAAASSGVAARPDEDDFFEAAVRALRRDRQEELRRFADALDPERLRALYFLHVLLPHTPWEYLPSGKFYATETDRIPGLVDETWQEEEAHVVQAYQRYLLQVQFLDRWLGTLVARLKDLQLYDRSLIVLAADHGVSFRPGDSRRALTATNSPDLIPVPLLIKAPYQRRGEVVERPVTTLDVLPTALELLDVDPPWPFDGSSAVAGAPGRFHRRVVGKHRDLAIDESLHRDKYATLDWKLATFGAGPAILRAGTHPELYGRRLDELAWREQDTVTLRLSGASLFDRGAESAYSPAFVRGVLETSGSDKECCDLAVAVNGTVYATVKTFGSPPDDLQFTALVPDAAFNDGPNRVDVFRVRGGGPRPELERLGSSGGAPYALVADAGDRVQAVRRDARDWPLEPGALRGYFTTERLPRELRVSGWAVDVEAGAAPMEVVAFYRGELVYGGATTKVRPDVNAGLGVRPTVRSAFQFDVPHSRIPESSRFGLRLFALSPRAASELGFFYALERDAGGRVERILLSNGREIPVAAGALTGVLKTVQPADGRLRVQGWAADVAHREVPERILVFAGGEAIYDSRSFVERPDVAAGTGMPEILRSGFDYDVAFAAAEGSVSEVLVFAVSRRGAAVLLPVYALERDGDGSPVRIRVPGGADLPIVPEAVAGYVDKMEPLAGGGLRVGGWAADLARREGAARILAFAAGELVLDVPFFGAREDVARYHGAPELLMTGFEHDLPGELRAEELLVFAVSRRGEATLLPSLLPALGQ